MSMTMTDALAGRFTADGFRGVAFYAIGPDIETFEPEPDLICDDSECDHDDSECYAWPAELEEVESETMVRAIMVGDDAIRVLDLADLTPLGPEDYCSECGQVGCGAYS